jgi:hypothetical protein
VQRRGLVTVRMIAALHTFRIERGLSPTELVEVPEHGIAALEIAKQLGLPLAVIDGVFHNYRGAGLDVVVRPGDPVAFVPIGTPASHPAFFGAFVTRDAAR